MFLHSRIYIPSILQQKYREIRLKTVDLALLSKFQQRTETLLRRKPVC